LALEIVVPDIRKSSVNQIKILPIGGTVTSWCLSDINCLLPISGLLDVKDASFAKPQLVPAFAWQLIKKFLPALITRGLVHGI
jgi:hypothetical protein